MKCSFSHAGDFTIISSHFHPSISVQSGLQDTRWQVRLEAVRAISENQSPDNLKLLLSALSDPDSDVRDAAAAGVEQYGHDALDDLQGILYTGNLNSREMVIHILLRLQDPDSQTAFINALLHDESAWVRIPAAQALGKSGGKEALTALMQALKDTHPDVIQAVRAALEQIGTPEAFAALKSHQQENG